MQAKKYNCEIEGCEWEGTMRSTIKNKDSEHYNKKVCPLHAKEFNEYKENRSELKKSPLTIPQQNVLNWKKRKKIKKFTQKGMDKRKENRKGYAEFFQKHIHSIRSEKKVCENCSGRLRGGADEVAHIISKGNHPSVATEDLNIVYLCSPFSSQDSNDCHSKFDKDLSTRGSMPVFEIAKQRYKLFKDKVLEMSRERLQLEDENF